MGKSAKLLPPEYKQRAIDNDISLITVYKRLERGWDLERAVTEKSKKIYDSKTNKRGEFESGDRPKSTKTHAFTNYEDNEELYQKALSYTGKNSSQFIADLVDSWLKKNKKKLNS